MVVLELPENTINRRLNPKRTDSDYYLLKCVREKVGDFVKNYLVGREGKVVVLDYGCGDTPYKALFLDYSSEYIAADLPGNSFANMTVLENGIIPCDDESIDIVISMQVLEHVYDTSFYLSESFRVLKNKGMLLLSTHGYWTYHPYPNDYWRWTRQGLLKIIKESGFDIIDIQPVVGILAYSFQLRVQCFKGILENKGPLFDYLFCIISYCYQKIMCIADKITPHDISSNNAAIFIVTAEKPTKEEISSE
jgi:SAM-dependent methyltransferase